MPKKSGFTIVEVLISAVIFSLLIVGLTSVFIAGKKLIIHSRERMTSVELAKLFLDPLQAYVRLDTWSQASNQLGMMGTWSGTAQNINNRTFSEQHVVSGVASTDLRRVVSTISWPEHN
jgi:prepilin-type N-terminal cleavage/methylation domain-containing protein